MKTFLVLGRNRCLTCGILSPCKSPRRLCVLEECHQPAVTSGREGKRVKFQFWVNRAFNTEFFVFPTPPSRVSLSADLLTLSFIFLRFLCFFSGPQTCFSLNSFRHRVISSLTHSTSSSLSSQTSLRFLFFSLPLLCLCPAHLPCASFRVTTHFFFQVFLFLIFPFRLSVSGLLDSRVSADEMKRKWK